jgi:hypothetical protein
MPRGSWPVCPIELLDLRVAQVSIVVTPPVTQIDPPNEGHVLSIWRGVSEQYKLLVVGAGGSHPLIEQE